MIAGRISRVGMSATLRMSTAAKQLRADGIDIVDLSVGVSNDAVNFLNSAIGSRVASRRVILINAGRKVVDSPLEELTQGGQRLEDIFARATTADTDASIADRRFEWHDAVEADT